MPISVEDAREFIADAEKAREGWLQLAERSWGEIKKRSKAGKLWSSTPNSAKRKSKYPAWFSIFKIRQPLLLSRVGVPIGRDVTQDGTDNIGSTAAILLERLAVNLAKSFDFFDVMAAARDDFLATNFGIVRAYYERDEVKQEVKERIKPIKDPETGDVVFVNDAGQVVESDDIGQDDEGYFLETEEVIDVENEKICLEPVLYKNVYVDPDIKRWKRCERLAFSEQYSERRFKQIFGAQALIDEPKNNNEKDDKKKTIEVFEYWDLFEKECYWFTKFSKGFLKPLVYPEESDDVETRNGLYDLEGMFPVPPPLIMNSPTDEFWPVPEYYQVMDILDDIHILFSRMMGLTKAIRARLLFDNNVEGLESALHEASEGDTFGVTNLSQALSTAGGTLDNVVQYIPVEKLIQSLSQVYTALDQRLSTLFRLTGTSDLLQGLSQDQSGKTLGERQMEEKYAVNQIAEAQRKMSEFVRDSYQLLCEMALKNFKEQSLETYIMPRTLQPEDQNRYRAALALLKEDQKRFRVELETDSTIALNEQYDKQMRIELVNALTGALEKTANIAQTSPALLTTELHCLKFLVQGFRQGKLFQSEITAAIDAVIEQAKTAEPAFNKDQAQVQLEAKKFEAQFSLEQSKLKATTQLEVFKMQGDQQIKAAELQQAQAIAAIQNQLDGFKIQSESSQANAELQLKYQEISAQIAEAQQKLALERDALMVELRKVVDKKEADQFAMGIDARVKTFEMQLSQAQQSLEEQKASLDMREKYMTEARLQSEHELEKVRSQMDAMAKMTEAQKPQPLPPITIQMPQPASKKKKIKMKHDEYGNIQSLDMEDIQDAGE
jgi:hypothetical protein